MRSGSPDEAHAGRDELQTRRAAPDLDDGALRARLQHVPAPQGAIRQQDLHGLVVADIG